MPRKKQPQNVRDALKGYNPEKVTKRIQERTANLELRKKIKEAELRSNLRNEYDRLVGESTLIPQIRATHGDRVAENASKVINARREQLKTLYKNSVSPTKHDLAKY